MNTSFSRRGVLVGAAALFCARNSLAAQMARSAESSVGVDHIVALEKRAGGRIGFAALDTATGRTLQYRQDERFALCSTFKFLAAAAVLQRVDQGQERLDRWVAYGEQDLLEYAPVSREHVKEHGMSLADLCAAAVELSDNTAANLMLQILGGPAALTSYIRTLGDSVTRLDRNEPELNVVAAGDVRDTTTPASMVNLLQTLLLGNALKAASRKRLEDWMVGAKVGERRVPAGLPASWRTGHKTGTGSDETNDVGIVWPPDRAPMLFAAFYSQGKGSQAHRDGVLRDLGKILVESFLRRSPGPV